MKNKCDDVIIRLSKNSERNTIKDLVNTVFKKYSGHIYARDEDRLSAEGFQSYHDKKELFVAEKDGNIIGCVTLSPEDSNTVLVEMLVVREDLQKQGIGGQLMDHIIQLALSNKSFKKMLVETWHSTHQPDPWNKIYLPRYYHKLGFKLVDSVNLLEKFPSAQEILAHDVTVCIHEKMIN